MCSAVAGGWRFRATDPRLDCRPLATKHEAMRLRGSWGMLVAGCVLSLASHGCGESSKPGSLDARADAPGSTGGVASGGVSGNGGGQAGVPGEVGAGGTGGVGGVGTLDAARGAGGVGPMDAVGSTGGIGGVGAIDAVGVDAPIALGLEVGSDAARFACGGRTCVVGEAYCRTTQGGVGGAPGASGAGGSSGGPPGSCTSFPVTCTTRLDCTCLCGSPTCRTMTSQCDVSDGGVYYTLYNP
jgi:hypothetical protein